MTMIITVLGWIMAIALVGAAGWACVRMIGRRRGGAQAPPSGAPSGAPPVPADATRPLDAYERETVAAAWILSGIDGGGNSVRLVVSEGDLARAPEGQVIGRHVDHCELVIDDESLSRRHARLTLKGRRLMIEDLGSTNGTSVDGKPLALRRPVVLKQGATVGLGKVRLSLARN